MKFYRKCDREYQFEVVSLNGSICVRDLNLEKYVPVCRYIDNVLVVNIICIDDGCIIATFDGKFMTYLDTDEFIVEV